ncbi:MAG: glucan biosynthesis protein [Paracoccaceae bacterium]
MNDDRDDDDRGASVLFEAEFAGAPLALARRDVLAGAPARHIAKGAPARRVVKGVPVRHITKGAPVRRDVIAGAAALALSPALASRASAQAEGGDPRAFGFEDVVAEARGRAGADYQDATMTLDGPFAGLDYDRYRAIRFRRELDPLGGEGAFGIDLLPPGSVFTSRVDIAVVRPTGVDDLAFRSGYFHFDTDYFEFPDGRAPEQTGQGLGFSGFRLRAPLNRPEVLDEVAVFQGASYFRAVARDMLYGLSARGLSIRTADPRGEEFPVFRKIWIHEPEPDAASMLVHALLDSPSATGAFRFEIRPGDVTVMDTECRLFPRLEIAQAGIAALTSMYYFGPDRRAEVDDFRDAVHDSQGLQMITGRGDRLWRPLSNPATVQVSAFQDGSPRGFGLTQRRRDFGFYQDAEARYDRRPSCWIEPLGDWGPGAVMLVEIPVNNEFNDNIVSFWRPQGPLAPAEEGHTFRYRLHWCDLPPDRAPIYRVRASRGGTAINEAGRRVMVVDFACPLAKTEGLAPEIEASVGEVADVVLVDLPGENAVRASFTFDPGEALAVELRLVLKRGDEAVSETWLHRWTAR